jgi:hypothetical protein
MTTPRLMFTAENTEIAWTSQKVHNGFGDLLKILILNIHFLVSLFYSDRIDSRSKLKKINDFLSCSNVLRFNNLVVAVNDGYGASHQGSVNFEVKDISLDRNNGHQLFRVLRKSN